MYIYPTLKTQHSTLMRSEDLKTFLEGQNLSNLGEVCDMIDEFNEIEQKKFKQLKKDNKITFGRYRGYTPKELALTEKGKDYLSWLLTQDWMMEKRSDLVEHIKELGIKKKSLKRTPLE